jgi:hypothetical protein
MRAEMSVRPLSQAPAGSGEPSPVVPPQRSSADRIPRWIAFCVLAVALGALMRRTPGMVSNPQFWAEDGVLFFRDAYDHPFASIFQPYNGYFLLVARLLAMAATLLPPRFSPAVYVWMSAAIMLAVCALALSPRLALGRSSRCIMALAVAVAPAPHEVFSSLTNSQWIVALALVLIAASSPAPTAGDKLRDVLVVLLAGLTGPFSVLFVPLFLLRALQERSRFSLALLGLLVICASMQSFHLGTTRIGDVPQWRDMISAVALHGSRLFASLLRGPSPWALGLFVALATGLVYAALLWHGLRRPAPAVLIFTLASLLVLGASLWAYRGNPLVMAGTGRYLYVPAVTATWAIAALLPSGLSIAGLLLIASSSIFWLARPWRLVDFHWSDASSCIGVTDPCVIPINPPGWTIVLHPKPSP